jgi:pyruvate dehydrogenase E2 component (dihydrolipoamide acetyltransferase)
MPKARALARELGVDLAEVSGTGVDGMILPDDVRRAAAAAQSPAAMPPLPAGADARVARRVPLGAIGRSTVAALERAWQVPQFTQGILVDAGGLVRTRESGGERLTYMDLFLDAVVRAARAVPEVVARLVDRELHFFDSIDVSIATATEHGLLIPVLRDAAAFDLARRGVAWRGLVEQARAGRLGPDQMSGGVIALSNLGTRGVDYGTPLLPVGHTAIVFVGALAMRPLVVGERLEARPSIHVSITYDHRVVDGVLGSRFTGALREALLAPAA